MQEVSPRNESSDSSETLPAKRSYDKEAADSQVRRHYARMRAKQTHGFATAMKEKYGRPAIQMDLWDALGKLDDFADESDPDLELPNLHHLYQAAVYARDHGYEDWMIVTALLHDLGKVVYLRGCDEEGTTVKNQWAVVGDTWVTGCRLPGSLVYDEYNSSNPDMADPLLSTALGVYPKGIGMTRVTFAFNHDVYLADLLEHPLNRPHHSLPQEAIDIIRLHSCYPFFDKGEYKDLMDPTYDEKLLENLIRFNKCDLYSKTDKVIANLDMMKEEFGELIEKFFDGTPLWF
jgi:inositol oxygenase